MRHPGAQTRLTPLAVFPRRQRITARLSFQTYFSMLLFRFEHILPITAHAWKHSSRIFIHARLAGPIPPCGA